MRGIINCSGGAGSWAAEYFPGCDPYMLKVANKALLEYYVDLMLLAGVDSLALVASGDGGEARRHFGGGERWDLEISYIRSDTDTGVDELLSGCRDFIGDEDVLVISGCVFLDYDCRGHYFNLDFIQESSSLTDDHGNGLFVYRNGREGAGLSDSGEFPLLGVRSICGLEDYLSVNLGVLDGNLEHYILPGRMLGKGVVAAAAYGGDVTECFRSPVVVGGGLRMGEGAGIGPWVVCGNGVEIGAGARVRNAVITDGARVEEDADLGYCLISPGGVFRSRQ